MSPWNSADEAVEIRTHHQTSFEKYVVHRLRDVGGMEIVVIGITVTAVTFLHLGQKVLENCRRYFKLGDHPVAVEQVVAQVLHGTAERCFVQRKNVERPIV